MKTGIITAGMVNYIKATSTADPDISMTKENAFREFIDKKAPNNIWPKIQAYEAKPAFIKAKEMLFQTQEEQAKILLEKAGFDLAALTSQTVKESLSLFKDAHTFNDRAKAVETSTKVITSLASRKPAAGNGVVGEGSYDVKGLLLNKK